MVGWDLLSADYMSAARLFFVPSFSPLLTTPLSFRRTKKPTRPFLPLSFCARGETAGVWIKEEEEREEEKKVPTHLELPLRGRGSSEVLCYGRERQNPVLS